MLNTGSLVLIFLAIMLSLVPHDTLYGLQAALIAESFAGRLRYSGASLGYQLDRNPLARGALSDRIGMPP